MRIERVGMPGEKVEGGIAEAFGIVVTDADKADFAEKMQAVDEAERKAMSNRGRYLTAHEVAVENLQLDN